MKIVIAFITALAVMIMLIDTYNDYVRNKKPPAAQQQPAQQQKQ
jgi:hypothetical protein